MISTKDVVGTTGGSSVPKVIQPGNETCTVLNIKLEPARFKEGVGFFDIFNTGILLQANKKAEVYHKSKLVPGVEQLPYPEFFGLLGSLAIDLGGTAGGLGTQPNRTALGEAPHRMAPIICYESVYGGFCSDFMADNPSVIGIITNDGWWGDTPGHKHHLAYARLRAIESGKSIARSANTGISAFLNQRGDIEQQLGWWQKGALVGKVYLNTNRTIYSYFDEKWLSYILFGYLLIGYGFTKWGNK
jgi:apolipoprotein N-acyltransferase